MRRIHKVEKEFNPLVYVQRYETVCKRTVWNHEFPKAIVISEKWKKVTCKRCLRAK